MKNLAAFLQRIGRLLWILFFHIMLLLGHVNAQISITSDRGQHSIENDKQSLKIEYDGKITIGPDDRSITAISEGGYIRIRKTTFGNTRELFISNSGSGMNYEYKEGGHSKPFEPAGRAWLADILPEMMRSTTIGAQSRVDRLYQAGGVQAVLHELPQLTSDHVRAKYAALLFEKNIKESEVPTIINAIGQHISSDHYLYEVFKANSQLLLSNPNNMGDYLKAIETVNSDHYKTQLVKLAVNNQLPASQQKQVLQLIGTVDSDHYRTEILKEIIGNKLAEDEIEFLLGTLVSEIQSDHYRSEVIDKVLEEQASMSSQSMDIVIRSIGMNRSDHYRKETLEALIQHQKLSAQNYETLFNMLSNFSSDHYKAEFMKMLVRNGNMGQYMNLFVREVSNINSDHYRTNVLEIALGNTSFSEDQLVTLIKSADSIRSDHYKAEFLARACRNSSSEKVKDAIRQTAKTIHSSHHYGEVMKCVQ